MNKHKNDILALEIEMALVETGAFDEEKINAKKNYAILKKELDEINAAIPYPETTMYSTVAGDYSAIDDLNYEKSKNKPYWDKRDMVSVYYNNKSLYIGHVSFNNGVEYYLLENSCKSHEFSNKNGKVFFINVNDSKYRDIIRGWRFPQKNNAITFSRNIELENREVSHVEIVLDKSSESFSNITDRYLRNTLIRNKEKEGIYSIIQTIQEKQDNIIALPKDRSFIVQGCAGSGKTMVLLHRMKYLLFNQMIRKEDFVFIVPSNNFKEFIESAAEEFTIKSDNIIPIQSYYQKLAGEVNILEIDSDELAFNSKYLERVYSKDFIKESFDELLDLVDVQTSKLIDICENRFNTIIEKAALDIEESIVKVEKEAVDKTCHKVGSLVKFIDVPINSIEDIFSFLLKLKEKYSECREELKNVEINDNEIVIKDDDKRVIENKELGKLRADITTEEEAVKRAFLFTARGHKNKLKKLKAIYQVKYDELVKKLIEEDKRKLANSVVTTSVVFEDFTISDVEEIIAEIEIIYNNAKEESDRLNINKDNFEEHIENKYKEQIDFTNEIIESSVEIKLEAGKIVENLFPAVNFFNKYIQKARNLIEIFKEHLLDEDLKEIAEKCKLFSVRTEAKFEAYLYRIFFNICKRKIKEEFSIKISKEYKHYWYLSLYCRFLTRNLKNYKHSYIFIDEGQDLSLSEIELIYKINSKFSADKFEYLINPVLNIFGDTNQMIMSYGIEQWEDLTFINETYELNENFRNPNQIIQYCNDRLPIKMKKIGIDLDDVKEYNNVKDAIIENNSRGKNIILIVKDECARVVLEIEMSDMNLQEYDIFTVKEVKGLEYKEVFVINCGMSDNEKYIAYTRAVKKLNVINHLVK